MKPWSDVHFPQDVFAGLEEITELVAKRHESEMKITHRFIHRNLPLYILA